jgi:hypothetical protein
MGPEPRRASVLRRAAVAVRPEAEDVEDDIVVPTYHTPVAAVRGDEMAWMTRGRRF